MARVLHAYLPLVRVPGRAELQAEIQRLKFKLVLDEGYVPFDTHGYLPCTLEGEDAGVDLRFEREQNWPQGAPAAEEHAASGLPTRVVLRWGGDAREHLTALVIAAALAEGFGACLYEPDAGTWRTGAQCLKQAKTLLEDSF